MADLEEQNEEAIAGYGGDFGDYSLTTPAFDGSNDGQDGVYEEQQPPLNADGDAATEVEASNAEFTNAEEPSHVNQNLTGTASRNDDDERKIFVGGLHWETTVNELKEYFQKFGRVVDCTLKTDPATGRSRGFGFVLFESVACVDKVVAEKSHVLQGKTIDPKRAMARGGKDPVKKIFVGGISPDMPESDIREFFSKYGKIEEVELPFDRLKNQRRAYVFITFESEEIAEKACQNAKQKLGEREVDVRKATPRSEQDGGRGGSSQRGRGSYAARGGYDAAAAAAAAAAAYGYDYSAYYGYYGYPGYPGYDYSSYYGQDWSQYSQAYSQAYGYPGYDYSSWYSQDPNAAAAVTAAAGKTKRGGSTTPSYHPYSR